MNNYIVVGSKPWNYRIYNEIIKNYQGKWHFIQLPEMLNIDEINKINPRYIFFLHWSWKVHDELINKYECVCFHMTDVPYGRGGSPLQNLIIQGYQNTKLTALQMTQEFDAGAIYYQENLCLAGNAEEIYIRATYLSAQMIEYIIQNEPCPVEQKGEVTLFKRREPAESEIPEMQSLQNLYDFVRMLDAEGYPHAYIQHQGFQYSFRRAALYDGHIVADVVITPLQKI
ncbi:MULTISPECIES: methionyl-tRNA formyltransferase [Pseudanabaena]|uniref:Methionyl-tRNA formyltransferase n=2 Tax=Pseudanabaena TaxID=1152 RepID=L8N3T4_9CYAN|nr:MULTISPECIES: methionyl-tRNA formyltransferase [Pseudanabaena]ELS34321.1 methionyl-tRNA formyltransferase [Pseudanabaena biceps PCC 7429]MDG3493463.1 methionyl-tRNA formyltransferase [Pseudanabaena catenata USMAC16]